MLNNEQTPTVPPYLSVAKLDRVLDLAKTRTMSKVSTSLFDGYGFNQTDAALAVKFLKFIGAVDDDGNATSLMDKLRLESEDKRKQGFDEIVRGAYNKLFNSVKEPHKLSKSELKDEFRVQYGQSPRIIDSALPVFLRLCEHAGLIEAGTIPSRQSKPRAEKPKTTSTTSLKQHSKKPTYDNKVGHPWSSDTNYYVQQILKDKMTIAIPEDWHLRATLDDDLNAEWRAIIKAAHAFANSYMQKNPDQTPPETNADNSG